MIVLFQPIQDFVSERHEEYLINLQLRNRTKKQLLQKDQETKTLEKKEQGFSLYLNGANESIARKRNAENVSAIKPYNKKGQRQKKKSSKTPFYLNMPLRVIYPSSHSVFAMSHFDY